jgi:hypothetical protein
VSAGRDGQHLEDVVDPTADPAHDHPVFGAVSRSHKVPEKSLPVLRFGATYRVRVRALWLSGGIPDDRDDAPASDPIVYLRCEPYGPPGIRLDPAIHPPASAATHGGTIETAVLLSGDNPADPVTVWLTPPAAGIDLVEASGALDQLLRDDPARAYRLLAQHETLADAGFTPSPPTISYLADPELRGAVVENLPKWAGRAHYAIPASTGRAFLYFGGSWPAFGAARLVIRPGDSDWESDSATHEVRLSVPPAAELDLLVAADPPITNTLVLQWAPLAEATNCWAVCPRRVLHVVHAVRRPLAGPFLREELPRDPPHPLRGDLPVAQRAPDQTSYTVTCDLKAHRPSTGSIDVDATWEEVSETDGSRESRAVLAWREIIDQGGDPEPLPDDHIWFDARHELGDKKHRVITYGLTAISRFRAYFPDASTAPPADFTKPGTSLTVHLPATVAPPPPHIQRAVPAVRWSEESGSGWTRRTRRGNGVRLWLNGPWYVTGSGEVLAVILSAQGHDVDPEYAEKVTRLGGDRITLGVPEIPVIYPHWIEGASNPATSFQNFPLDVSPAATGSTAETFWLHTVTPTWDKDRGLWYADVFLISPWDGYRSFLHLRVARLQPWGLYQPASNTDLRLSDITSVPPAQLLPSRTLEVRRAGQSINVSLSAGVSYFRLPNAEARVEATVEQRAGNNDDPLAWRQLGNPTALTATGPWNQRVWTASPPLPAGGGALRVRVDEYEVYPGDGTDALRLAYTDAINLI